MSMLTKRDNITCPGRGTGWEHHVFDDPVVRQQYKSLACRKNQWAITSKKNAPSNWHGAMTTYVDQQTGRHSSDRPAGRQYNLLAFESAMVPATPSINDRPDQTGLTEQAQQAKENAVVMNRVLTKIEQGSEVLQPEEYKIRVTQEPKRVFPMSDVMETTLDSSFHAKNEDVPPIVCEKGSHFDPRHTREERAVNTDVMSRLTHWSTAIRDVLVALEHVLQTNCYENSQRKEHPSNMSQDLLMMKKMLDEGIRTREIPWRPSSKDKCAYREIGTACTSGGQDCSST